MDEIYDIVQSVVSDTDDPTIPALTFRVWLLGILFSVVLATVNVAFTFRTNFFVSVFVINPNGTKTHTVVFILFQALNPLIALLLAYPLGRFLAWILPRKRFHLPSWLGGLSFTFNPGPFTIKEHALIFIFSATGANPSYALYNIIGQKYLLNQSLSFGWCLVFGLVTNCFGYGIAGLTRKFLVRPSSMIWPTNLSIIMFLRSFHDKEDSTSLATTTVTNSSTKKGSASTKPSTMATAATTKKGGYISWTRAKFFWVAMVLMFIYQFFPSFIAPILGSVSLLCLVAPNNQMAKMMGSARQGMGLLSFSFDWSIISAMTPIASPFWAICNQFVGREY
jgi:OPT family oligopeptide transporter